jgi:hypothetical protein
MILMLEINHTTGIFGRGDWLLELSWYESTTALHLFITLECCFCFPFFWLSQIGLGRLLRGGEWARIFVSYELHGCSFTFFSLSFSLDLRNHLKWKWKGPPSVDNLELRDRYESTTCLTLPLRFSFCFLLFFWHRQIWVTKMWLELSQEGNKKGRMSVSY